MFFKIFDIFCWVNYIYFVAYNLYIGALNVFQPNLGGLVYGLSLGSDMGGYLYYLVNMNKLYKIDQ